MTALSADRNTPEREGKVFSLPVAGTKKIFAGSLVALSATLYATPGAAAAGIYGIGRAEEQVDNSAGADGDKTVRVKAGVFRWANSAAADAITRADIGAACFIVDDQTVARTDNAGARSVAGKVVDVDSQGVWVEMPAGMMLTRTASLNFPSIAAAASADLTIAVPGARANDAVDLGLPAAPTAGLVYQAFVSADDVVTVRAMNITAGAVDAAAQTFRVTVVKR